MTRRQFTITCLLWTALVMASWLTPSVAAQPPARGTPFLCTVINSTTATLAAFATSATCPAADAQHALYITDILASATTIATTTVDQYLVLKTGTGTNCGTGTGVIWAGYNLAFAGYEESLTTPIRVPPSNDLCWMDAVAGNKTFIVSGYIGQ